MMPKLTMPNLRKMFTPDLDHTIFEVDLAGADARIVAWEANDAPLKDAFRQGLDIHAFNAEAIWRKTAALSEYKIHPELKKLRFRAKTAIHAVDYGCKERTLADHIQVSVAEAGRFIDRWFSLHPGILAWQRTIQRQLYSASSVTNIWGYSRPYFDRPSSLLPDALAWIGQSTTAIAINKLIVALDQSALPLDILLQTHDSVTFQMLTPLVPIHLPRLRELCQVVVPYPDPLIMPCEIQSSTSSWGELEVT